MADLTAAEMTADPCCAPEQQASCCEPDAKADCCGHDQGCGCAAGGDVEIHEAHRVHAQAVSAIVRAQKPLA